MPSNFLLSSKIDENLLNWGLVILRVVVGLVFALHGFQKLTEMGISGVAGFFGSIGIPAAMLMAVIVTFVELLGGIALIVGVGTPVKIREKRTRGQIRLKNLDIGAIRKFIYAIQGFIFYNDNGPLTGNLVTSLPTFPEVLTVMKPEIWPNRP